MVERARALLVCCFTAFGIVALFSCYLIAGQKKQPVSSTPPVLLTRTTSRHEVARLGYGGSVTIVGAPTGAISVEGWTRSEVELTAEIELHAETEADLDRLARVNGFMFDEDLNHISVLTAGTHDRVYMKRSFKDFPKNLMNLPWKIDYKLKVPVSTDLEINAGHGPVTVSGVEGALQLSATESETNLTLTGGVVSATIAAGYVNLNIPVRSWRGAGADIRIAGGVLNVQLPAGFSGDFDADILRTGKIVNDFGGLEPREKPGITQTVMRARAGAGGAFFRFTVADGTINFVKRAE